MKHCRIVFRFKPYVCRPGDWQIEYHDLKECSYLEAFRLLYNYYKDDVEGVLSVDVVKNMDEI